MVETIKFSQFLNSGDLAPNETTVGLESGTNARFNNPFPLLPPGPTEDRPPIESSMYYRLRFNTTLQQYEYYSPVTLQWIQLQSSMSIQDFPFVIYKSEPLLPSSFNLGSLSSGVLKQSVTTGVSTPSIAVNGVDYYGPGFTGYLKAPIGVSDLFDNPIIHLNTVGASSVNYLGVTNSATTNPVILQPEGSDSNVPINLYSKGDATIQLGSTLSSKPISILTGTSYQHITNFNFSNTANTTEVTFQDSSGTVAYLSDIPGFFPAPMTKIDDENVTITLFGLPELSLINPVVLGMGWNGQLSLVRGGTNASLVADHGGIVYSTATGMGISASVADAHRPLLSGASTTPTWSPYELNLGGNFTSEGPHDLLGAFDSSFIFTGNTVVTFPTSGTLATTSQLPIPAALTVIDDVNLNITLTGMPSVALLQDVGLTLSWSGLLGLNRGGTNASLVADLGGIVYSGATGMAILASTATPNLPLLSGAHLAPTWSDWALNLGGDFTTDGSVTWVGAHPVIFNFTADTDVTFPTSGTLATTSELPTPSAMTAVSDTNVTLTLGGSPLISLLAATSLTMGWSGQLSLGRGGTGTTLVPSNGGIVYSNATNLSILPGVVTSGRPLISGASSAPSFSPVVYPSSISASNLLFATASNTIGEVVTQNSSVLTTNASGLPVYRGPLTDGQLIIGGTGISPAPGVITAGPNTTITLGPNSITIGTADVGVFIQEFTSSGTYTPTTGMKHCVVEMWGGGGAGAGADTASSTEGSAGTGGGSGARGVGVFTAADIGASQSVTIGAGGSGAPGTGGNDGSPTSLGSLMNAPGGSGGLTMLVTTDLIGREGGDGAAAGTGGIINAPGTPGFPTIVNGASVAISGTGGSTALGGAGKAVVALLEFLDGVAAEPNTGSGGSGSAIRGVTGSLTTGGVGGSGRMTITEYV